MPPPGSVNRTAFCSRFSTTLSRASGSVATEDVRLDRVVEPDVLAAGGFPEEDHVVPHNARKIGDLVVPVDDLPAFDFFTGKVIDHHPEERFEFVFHDFQLVRQALFGDVGVEVIADKRQRVFYFMGDTIEKIGPLPSLPARAGASAAFTFSSSCPAYSWIAFACIALLMAPLIWEARLS